LRASNQMLSTGRTIANLDGSEPITAVHLSEAIS
jgi:predicted ATPase with chaperone activity